MTDTKTKSKWGFGVFFLYSVFVIFILALVMYVSLQDFQLVEKDYYAKDLIYQKQIDRINRANKLAKKPTVRMSGESENILIDFQGSNNKNITGTIKFFKPSNARYDFELPIEIDSLGRQEINTKSMIPGFWKINIDWTIDSVEYFTQEPLMIN